MEYDIDWRPSAREDLDAIYDWIADKADSETAFAYIRRIEEFVAKLRYFPNRGTPRFDVQLGLRSVTYRHAMIVAYRVKGGSVRILRLIDPARDFERVFREPSR